MKKNGKVISLILVAAASFSALYFIVKQNIDAAVLSMTIMFTLTNFFRARTFKEQGHAKESKWMRTMAIIFAILSVVVLGIMIAG
ncbi:hypothetical protein DCE79_17000 [Lysinibacillus sp. 2017]|uniref:hypothetical protein n=1 Tax=unclassified Lysinibacillus TaxID=2636778 RepID=UPI000D525C90|nr:MULTISPECIES: hypothetical protein [unclassified Lysinibacillus]AWE08931.1 hypothetical protein DCE79_17000 [Lysinibacillus sp. 2017]TGN35559.1 hypothetical protein E4L99_09615 [Lysinibacillus sp. S2017]